MSKIGVEPVTAVPPKRCYQDLIVPPCSFSNQEFHFNKWPWTFLDHFQRQKEQSVCLVIADYFTKWTEAFPMSNMEAHTVTELFVYNFVCRFGAPDYLHTDQGCNFEPTLLSEICKLL